MSEFSDRWLRVSGSLDRLIIWVSYTAAWVIVLGLVVSGLADVIGRQFFGVSLEILNTSMAILFLALVMLFLGHAYLKDIHVRIDIVRERLKPRTAAWIELAGILLVLFPLCWIVVAHGAVSVWSSFRHGESLDTLHGFPVMWVIEAAVPIGFLLLTLAAVSVFIRNVLYLCGRHDHPAPQAEKR
jgi:TRAP-type mannitol/chloroaromatic compound transport system permease small subunit